MSAIKTKKKKVKQILKFKNEKKKLGFLYKLGWVYLVLVIKLKTLTFKPNYHLKY